MPNKEHVNKISSRCRKMTHTYFENPLSTPVVPFIPHDRINNIINEIHPTLSTVAPESIVIPIVSCIFGFPVLALLVICCLRKRAKMARERDRRRNYDLQDHTVSLVRFSPIHRLSEYLREIGRHGVDYYEDDD